MTTLLSPAAWARRSAAHPWRVVAAWAGALIVSIAIIATLLAGALTTEQDFVSNPESKRAASKYMRASKAAVSGTAPTGCSSRSRASRIASSHNS